MKTPTIEEIKKAYYFIVPIFKGVRDYAILKELSKSLKLSIEINGTNVNNFGVGYNIPEKAVDFVRIDSYEILDYIYFYYDKDGNCTNILFDVWSYDVDSDFIVDTKIEDIEKAYADGIEWVEKMKKKYEEIDKDPLKNFKY